MYMCLRACACMIFVFSVANVMYNYNNIESTLILSVKSRRSLFPLSTRTFTIFNIRRRLLNNFANESSFFRFYSGNPSYGHDEHHCNSLCRSTIRLCSGTRKRHSPEIDWRPRTIIRAVVANIIKPFCAYASLL